MFCPECRVEYREGFRRCSDCDVNLVDELPPKTSTEKELPGKGRAEIQDSEKLRSIWGGDTASECADTCRELQKGGIPYRVSQSVVGRSAKMGVEWEFKIKVRATDYEVARKVLGYIDDETEAALKAAEANGESELPAQDDMPVTEVHGDWKPRDWFPEDATVEVWGGSIKESGSIVEMSLKENRIDHRVELWGEGMKRVLVLPVDESRAREIVREIVEGTPPE